MSRRLPASTLVVSFLLLAGVLLALAIPPAAAFGETPHEWNQVVNGTNHLDVHAGQSVAQSFVASETYVLVNLTLRLRNTGSLTDSLNVTVRADAAGVPAAGYLTASNVFAAGSVGLVSVPFAAPPALTSGVRYWIVATHAGILAEGYEWHHSLANVYAPGKAVLDAGVGWTDVAPATDMYFLTHGRPLATSLSVDVVAPASSLATGETTTFRVFVNNTGTQASGTAWVNVTLSPELVYVGDTAGTSSTAFPALTFTGLGNGAFSFDVTVRIAIGVDPGTLGTMTAALAYVNGTGAWRPGGSDAGSVTIGIEMKSLYLVPGPVGPSRGLTPILPVGSVAQQTNVTLSRGTSYNFDLTPALARPFRATDLRVTLYLDSPGNDARDLVTNLTLIDWNGVTIVPVAYHQSTVRTNNLDDFQEFTFDFSGFDHTLSPGERVRLRALFQGTSGSDAVLAMNSTFARSRLDLTTTTYVRIDALELRDASGPAALWSSRDALVVRANVSDPFGASEIVGARINVTAPGGGAVASWAPMTLLVTDPATPSAWELYGFTVSPFLGNGTYSVRVTAIEGNGVVDLAEGTALVRSPDLRLDKVSTTGTAKGGDRFDYQLWYNNTGSGSASRVWINDTLPSQVMFQGSSEEGARTGAYNWSWTNVGPGSYRLDIAVQVRGGVTDAFIRNTATLVYADEKGHLWPPGTSSVDVVLRGPLIALTLTPSASGVHGSESLTDTIRLSNSGDPAQNVWLNLTLPADLSYVSDTSASLGGISTVSGGDVRFAFGAMAAGATWTFTMGVRATASLTPGEVFSTTGTLDYTNENGVSLPQRSAQADVTALAPRIVSASFQFLSASVAAGNPVAGSVVFENQGNEGARDLWLNLTLDPFLAFLNASAPATVAGSELRFTMSGVGLGVRAVYVNLTALPTVPDRRTVVVGGRIDYSDAAGNLLLAVAVAPDSVLAGGSRITLSVSPNVATVEAGTVASFTVFHANAGSGTAGDVWLNLSLPASFVYVSDDSDGERTTATSLVQWHWTDQAPGPKSFELFLQAKPLVADRTQGNLSFEADYTDVAGASRNRTTASALVTVIAPSILLEIRADRPDVLAGGTVVYAITLRNTGSTAARTLWLLDPVDARLEIVSHTARVRAEGAPELNWTFPDVQPGQVETFELHVRVLENLAPRTLIANAVEAAYTNSEGLVLGYVRSLPVTVAVAVDPMPLVYILLGGLALGSVAVVYVWRRHKVAIEEVFLVYRDGVLMYHLSRTLVQEKDEDVLSGMLTAVQEFVRDAFRYGEHRELHSLDFGDYKILIERGRMVYLAVVYSGADSSLIRRKVRGVLDHIETAYARELGEWDGDMDKIVGARDMIRDLLFKGNGILPRATTRLG